MTDQIIDQLDGAMEPRAKKMPYALRFGLIAGLLAAVYSLITYFAGQEYNRNLQWLASVIPLVLTFMCLSTYKKDNFHRLTFGEGFKLGMLFFIVYMLVSGLFMVIYMQLINPEFLDIMMEMSVERLEDRGMSDEEIEMAMNISGKFMTPVAMVVMGFIMNLIMGSIISLIASAILKTPHQD